MNCVNKSNYYEVAYKRDKPVLILKFGRNELNGDKHFHYYFNTKMLNLFIAK